GIAGVFGRVACEVAGGHSGVVPHGDLAVVVGVQALGETGVAGARFAGRLDEVDVEVDGRLEFRLVELGIPLLVEPAPAVGVDDRVEWSELLAPSGQAAQADARNAGRVDGLG